MRFLLFVLVGGAVLPLALVVGWGLDGFSAVGLDFTFFWNAGRPALTGDPVYANYWFPYPPHSLFLFAPFSALPLFWGYAAFNLFGAALFVWASRTYLPKGFPLLLGLCTPAALFCLWYGQTGIIVGALWLLAWQGRWPAVALLTFKPHLGILSALALDQKAAVKTTVLVVAMVGASLLAFGQWDDFVRSVIRQSDHIGVISKWAYIGVSPGISYGLYGWAIFAVLALYLLSRNVNVWSAATAALLVSPYGMQYDMPAASLGFAIALYKEETFVRSAAYALALLIPVWVTVGAWIAPPILLWALWAQTRSQTGSSPYAPKSATGVSPPTFR